MLSHGLVDYVILKRGDILYQQDQSKADSQFMILSGKVSIIRTFVDHNLIYLLKKEKKLSNVIKGIEEHPHHHQHDKQEHEEILEAIQEDPWMKDKSSSSEQPPADIPSLEESVSLSRASSENSVSEDKEEAHQKGEDSTRKSKSKSSSPVSLKSHRNPQTLGGKFGEFLHDLDGVVLEKEMIPFSQQQASLEESKIKPPTKKKRAYTASPCKDDYCVNHKHKHEFNLKKEAIDK